MLGSGSFRDVRLSGQATHAAEPLYVTAEFPCKAISTIDQNLPGQCPGVPGSGSANGVWYATQLSVRNCSIFIAT